MKTKKLLSFVTALTVFAGMTSAVLAQSQVIETTDVIRNLDFTDVSVGSITSDELAEMGFTLVSDADTVSAPAAEIKETTDHVDGSSTNINTLSFTINKGMKFTLNNNFNIPDKNGTKPTKVNVSYWYKVERPETKNPAFWPFGQLSKTEGVNFINPTLDSGGWHRLDETAADDDVDYFGFGQWNKMEYEIDYTANKAKITKSLTWSANIHQYEKDITAADTPDCLTWKQVSDLESWADTDTANLYFDDIQITATYSETIYDKPSAENTFFDSTDGSSTELAVYSNNTYQSGEYGSIIPLNRTELPANIDYVGYRFDGATDCENAKLIIAQYSDKVLPELVNASIDDVNVINGTVFTKSPLNLQQQNGTYVQAFLWDGFDKILPLADSADAQIVPDGTTLLNLDFENCKPVGWAYNKADNTFTNDSGEKVNDPVSTDTYQGFANWCVQDDTDAIVLQNSNSNVWTTAIVPDETAKYGTTALRAYASIPAQGAPLPGFASMQENTALSSALSNASADSIFRISFYAKAAQADASITAKILALDGINNGYQFNIFHDLTVKAGDWQHFIIYFAPRSDGDLDWSTKFRESPYDRIEFTMNSTVEQPIYFDNIKIEQIN